MSQDSPRRRGDAEEDAEKIRRWVAIWKEAGPELEAIRRREVAEADNLKALALLEDAFTHAVETISAAAFIGISGRSQTGTRDIVYPGPLSRTLRLFKPIALGEAALCHNKIRCPNRP